MKLAQEKNFRGGSLISEADAAEKVLKITEEKLVKCRQEIKFRSFNFRSSKTRLETPFGQNELQLIVPDKSWPRHHGCALIAN